MKPYIRPLRKKAKPRGRGNVDPFLYMLNEVPKRPEVARIEKVLNLIIQAETSLSGWKTADEVTAAAVDVSDFLAKWRTSERCRIGYEKAIADLNKILDSYSWKSVIMADSAGFKEEIRVGDPSRWENSFIRVILDELRDPRRPQVFISSFRKCIECDRWFMRSKLGPRGRQKWCGANCKKKVHSGSPEFKKTRRDYMRKLRLRESCAEYGHKEYCPGPITYDDGETVICDCRCHPKPKAG
jgi:hypothetical protein